MSEVNGALIVASLSAAELTAIRLADEKIKVCRDKFGGLYVLKKDAGIFGRSALVHRRQLLAHIAKLEAAIAGLPVSSNQSSRS